MWRRPEVYWEIQPIDAEAWSEGTPRPTFLARTSVERFTLAPEGLADPGHPESTR